MSYFISYPTILILCWAFLIINQIVLYFDKPNTSVRDYLADVGVFLQSLCYLQGFLSFLQFMWFERRMTKILADNQLHQSEYIPFNDDFNSFNYQTSVHTDKYSFMRSDITMKASVMNSVFVSQANNPINIPAARQNLIGLPSNALQIKYSQDTDFSNGPPQNNLARQNRIKTMEDDKSYNLIYHQDSDPKKKESSDQNSGLRK